jgi:hypothetical protein
MSLKSSYSERERERERGGEREREREMLSAKQFAAVPTRVYKCLLPS